MTNYLKAFNTHTHYELFMEEGNPSFPNVSYCKDREEVHYNPIPQALKYFTIEAVDGGKIGFGYRYSETSPCTYMEFSKNNGETWTRLNPPTLTRMRPDRVNYVIIGVLSGDKILWRGINETLGYWDDEPLAIFCSTGRVNLSGNIMSLLYGDDFEDLTIFPDAETSFSQVFSDIQTTFHGLNDTNDPFYIETPINNNSMSLLAVLGPDDSDPSDDPAPMVPPCISCLRVNYAHNLVLPVPNITTGCYAYMFANTPIITAPKILPAMTLEEFCYVGMFINCKQLTTVPELPATTLAYGCYSNMFLECEQLLKVMDTLPATTLADECYSGMFAFTDIECAPELPALVLNPGCYTVMFYGCENLNYIKALFTAGVPDNWVAGVGETGTFVKNANSTYNTENVIPEGWEIQNYSVV